MEPWSRSRHGPSSGNRVPSDKNVLGLPRTNVWARVAAWKKGKGSGAMGGKFPEVVVVATSPSDMFYYGFEEPLGAPVGRVGEDGVGRALLDYLPVVEDQHPVRDVAGEAISWVTSGIVMSDRSASILTTLRISPTGSGSRAEVTSSTIRSACSGCAKSPSLNCSSLRHDAIPLCPSLQRFPHTYPGKNFEQSLHS